VGRQGSATPQRTSDSQKGRDTGSEGLEIGDSEQKAKIDMAEMGGGDD